MMKRQRWWLVGIGIFTAFLFIFSNGNPLQFVADYYSFSIPVSAQSPPPSVPSPTPAPAPTPQPQSTPTPPPKPKASAPIDTGNFQLSEGVYQNQTKGFEIGMVEGFKQSNLKGTILFESADGNLAYTGIVQMRSVKRKLNNAGISQIAIEAFERGENFTPGQFKRQPQLQGITIPWTGTVSLGRQSIPVSGEIFARQEETKIFLLLISATDAQKEQVTPLLNLLAGTMKSIPSPET